MIRGYGKRIIIGELIILNSIIYNYFIVVWIWHSNENWGRGWGGGELIAQPYEGTEPVLFLD